MTTRTEFLARIRSGLGRSADTSVVVGPSPDIDDQLMRLAKPGKDLPGLFAIRAVAAGMIVHRCTPHTLANSVQALLASLGAMDIVLDQLDPPLTQSAVDALAGCGARVIDPRAAKSLDPQFDADAGITGVVAAIAETGTLVLASDATRSRGTFIIPPVHIALVTEAQIIPDMLDLWPLVGSPLTTALTLITGPSKTADIEGILVTGVHGPGAVHVILISDTPIGLAPRTASCINLQGDPP